MRSLALVLALSVFGCAAGKVEVAQVPAGAATVAPGLAAIARRGALGEDVAAKLREAGPAGLAAALQAFDAEAPGPRREALAALVDRVAAQRDATTARLYWFTDLGQAKAVARATGRPILSLRLLGRLDQELSCANSRFFRTALYPDRAVNAILRDRFVLHWSSERPAPVATIDFGDGRKIVRTVTGNSLHYVLDAEGRPVDAIPGLYTPAAFVQALENGEKLAKATGDLDDDARAKELARLENVALDNLRTRWSFEVGGGVQAPTAAAQQQSVPRPPSGGSGAPTAVMAMPVAMSKAAVEAPMVRALLPGEGGPPPEAAPWSDLATRHADEARLDAPAIALIRAKNPMNWQNGTPRRLDDVAFSALVARFEHMMEEDTLKNEFVHHAAIRRWLAAEPRIGWAALNARVYREIFLTPANDPWLGLVPPGAFTGIENDGIVAK
jgi:hypothetical protein